MHQTTCSISYLHVFDVDSELWTQEPLVTQVSPRILEAMNLILEKDGVRAYIGTRSEFGLYLAKLAKRHAEGIPVSWISYPDHTLLSMLGLCRNTEIPGKPEVAFYGSPLTLALAHLMGMKGQPAEIDSLMDDIESCISIAIKHPRADQFGSLREFLVVRSELQRALSYYQEINSPFGPQQRDHPRVGLSTLRIG